MKKIHSKGMTLIELVITMVVLAIGLSGILMVMIAVAKNSVDPQLEWQAIMLGDKIVHKMLNKHDDYQSIQKAPIDKYFPTLAKYLNVSSAFEVSIDIQPAKQENYQDALLIIVNINHAQLGDITFSAIKTKESRNDEKRARVYTY